MAEPVPAETVRIRRGTAQDGPATERLSRRAFSPEYVEEPEFRTEAGVEEAGTDPDPAVRAAARPPPPLVFVAEQGGRILASASATLRGQWFGGRRTLCAAIGGVAVGVEARGLGVGRALMAALLTAARDAGATTSALIPSTHRFYAGLGYGIGGRRPVFALSTAELRGLPVHRPRGLLLRRTADADAGAVAALVRDRAARGTGLLDHGGAEHRTASDPTGGDSYVADVDGAVRGWCLLSRREPSTRYASYDLVVDDLVAGDPDVELVLWRLLVGDHPSALRADAVLAPGSLLEHRLERQRELVEGSSWMIRLLDVDRALTARGYPPPLTAELVLDVVDPVWPRNEGPRVLSVAAGSARVRPAPGATPDVVVGVGDLASLFTAHLDPFDARYQGRLGLAGDRLPANHAPDNLTPDDRSVATLRALFAGPPALLARTF